MKPAPGMTKLDGDPGHPKASSNLRYLIASAGS